MSNQNDRGGGFLLWGISLISSKLRNRKIRKYNKQSRGLEQHTSVSVDALFPPQSFQDNILISGGDDNTRLRFSQQILINAHAQNHAVIVLCSGNSSLENIICHNNIGIIASRQNKIFDAFTSFELHEIYHLVLDVGRAKYNINPAGRYILQIVCELLAAQNMKPYFANFANFNYHKIADEINKCLSIGQITQSKADDLNSLLAMGQSELPKIDTFFYDMNMQMSNIAAISPNSTGGPSILSAIRKKQIYLIDINSSANSMFMDLIASTFAIALSRGYSFAIFIDDVSLTGNDALKNVLHHTSSQNNIISSKDIFTMHNSDEQSFSTVVGLADKTILLSHGSHISCEMWSKYIGEYDKIDTSQSSGGGWFQSSRWGFISNQSQTETMKREQKIKPDEINRLSQSQIFAYDNKSGSLVQANVI